MNPDSFPALLKTELDWLQHKIKLSKVKQRIQMIAMLRICLSNRVSNSGLG